MKPAEFHPAASALTTVNDAVVKRLVESIRKYGQLVSIVRIDGKIYDGRKRFLACQELGIKPRYIDYDPDDADSLVGVNHALNFVREHFTQKEQKEAERKLLKLNPERSDRDIAAEVGRSHHSVAATREELEETGQIAQFRAKGGRGKRKGKPKPPEEPKDALGNVIPENLRELFADEWYAETIKELDAIIRKLDIVATSVESYCVESDNPHLDGKGLQNAMSMAIHKLRVSKKAVQDAKPYAVIKGGWEPFRGD